jgi:hypothetical protein
MAVPTNVTVIAYPGPPTTHQSYQAWAVNDIVIDSNAVIWRCTHDGTADAGGAATFVEDPGGLALGLAGGHMTGVFFPMQAPTASAPAYVLGGMYFDTTLKKLRIGGASAWETVSSS